MKTFKLQTSLPKASFVKVLKISSHRLSLAFGRLLFVEGDWKIRLATMNKDISFQY